MCLDVSLELLLLNEAAVVLVNDPEGFLYIIGRLAGQARHLEESLVVERFGGCKANNKAQNSKKLLNEVEKLHEISDKVQ